MARNATGQRESSAPDYGAVDSPTSSGGASLGTGITICWPSLIRFGFLILGLAASSSSIVIPWAVAIFDSVSPFLIV